MTIISEGNACPFNVEVVNLSGANEPFNPEELLSEAEWLGLRERYSTWQQDFELLIGFKDCKRVIITIIPNAPQRSNGKLLKPESEQYLVALGCDNYICLSLG